jgi:hypothetical protein
MEGRLEADEIFLNRRAAGEALDHVRLEVGQQGIVFENVVNNARSRCYFYNLV